MTLEIVDNRKKHLTTFGKLNVGDLFVWIDGDLRLKVLDVDLQTNCITLNKFDCRWVEDGEEVTRVSGKLVLE